jgi:hypothetical protein
MAQQIMSHNASWRSWAVRAAAVADEVVDEYIATSCVAQLVFVQRNKYTAKAQRTQSHSIFIVEFLCALCVFAVNILCMDGDWIKSVCPVTRVRDATWCVSGVGHQSNR